MFNEEKVKDVYRMILENQYYDNRDFINVLMILSPVEFDYFIKYVVVEKKNIALFNRLERTRPMLEIMRNNKIEDIYNSDAYKEFMESLLSGSITSYLERASKESLANIKSLLNMTVTDKRKDIIVSANKIISKIESEIRKRDMEKKVNFQANPVFS